MISPHDYTPFADQQEKCAQLHRWGLLGEGQDAREYVYTGAYTDTPVLCSVVGAAGRDVAVISVAGQTHCIYASCLAEMQKGYLSRSLPETYAVVDLETTGLSAKRDQIIEFAAIRYHLGQETARLSLLSRPSIPLRPEITNLTGLTPEMLEDAPPLEAVFPSISDFLGNDAIVAHNAPFDTGFLREAYAAMGVPMNNASIDTLKLARAAFPAMPNYKLSTLKRELGIHVSVAHRAMPDVEATAALLRLCVSELLKKGRNA